MPASEKIYLLADMHLKPLDATRRKAREMALQENEKLAAFLASIQGKAKSIILLGDTFNFWFERRSHVVGDYFTALSLFKVAADHGIEIHHISGNRDFVIGEGLGFDPLTRYPGFLGLRRGFTVSRLTDYGVEPHGGRYRFHHAGKTVCCVHGDGFCTNDRLFMALRWLLRGRIGLNFWRFAPWGVIEAIISRQQARTGIRGAAGRPGEALEEKAVGREMAMGADLVICGHIHAHHEREVELAGRRGRLVAIPPWLEGYYGILENGTVQVHRFE